MNRNIDRPAGKKIAAGVGGHVAMEFANTASWHLSTAPKDRLRDWADVVRWMSEMELIGTDVARLLSNRSPDIAGILALREDIFALGRALAIGEGPDAGALERTARSAGGPSAIPVAIDGRVGWRFEIDQAVAQFSTLLAREALSLLGSVQASKIRICEGGECGWLFVDQSRSGRRRWCSMIDCGSRAKAKRHYQRTRSAE